MTDYPAWKKRLPFQISTLLLIVMIYMFGWGWSKTVSIIMSQYHEEVRTYGSFLFGEGQTISMFTVFVFSIISVIAWLLSTRVKFYQKRYMRVTTFVLAVLSIWGMLASYGMAQSRMRFIPYFQERLQQIIETDGFFESIVFEQTKGFFLMLTMMPLFVMFFISLFILTKYVRHDKELNERFFEFQWNGRWLQRFSKLEKMNILPDIELGINARTKELIIIPGGDRTLNTAIVGSIGTGKTAALGLPILNQDLHHMVTYINSFPNLYERDDFFTEKVGGQFLNGISVIDPSNDLCQKTLKLVKAHGIPDEAITYINPLDPDTPSINAMRGPVDKVAEVFAQVIAGLNDSKNGGNSFFEQAERNHLKHYIYLLKLHDPNKDVILDMLLDMYNNPQLVRKMHEQLKKTFPPNYDDFENREERNYWKIVQGIDEWFDLNLLPKQERVGNMMMTVRNENNEIVYYDVKEVHVQGLRNVLNDIGANPLIRRVLFGHSDFDFDRHMAIGGVLLVNTAKGELVNLARVLGKIVIMNLQNATFRRLPIDSPFHHILIDEAPDYLYNAFREFPAQSRKYKVMITTLQQSIAQLADQFGEYYMETIIGTMRNRMVYADVPNFDAKYFSDMFGEKDVYEEGQNEMSVSPLQEDPVSRSGSQYSKVREQAMTGSDIMFQDAFECAVKIVVNNKTMPVVQIAANFVPDEEFEVAKYVAVEEAADIWLRERRLYGTKPAEQLEQSLVSVEETEYKLKQLEKEYEEDEQNHVSQIDPVLVKRAIEQLADPQPRDGVVYQPHKSVESKKMQVASEPEYIDLFPPIEDLHVNVTHKPDLVKAEQSTASPVVETLSDVDPAPVISGLDDLVSKWVEEDDDEYTPPPVESEYVDTQLNEENEAFMKKFGVSMAPYKE